MSESKNLLGDDAEERKQTPIYSGFVRNFYSGMVAVARRSYTGSRQHHPERDTQWDRSLSFDELDAMQRHLLEYADAESRNYYEGMAEATKAVAWRAMAHAERFFGTKPCDPECYQRIQRLREASQELAEMSEFTEEAGGSEVTEAVSGAPLRYFFNTYLFNLWRSDGFWLKGGAWHRAALTWDLQTEFIEDDVELEVYEADLPYLKQPEAGEWKFAQPDHGKTYLMYSEKGHGVENHLHKGVRSVGKELEGYRWVKA